MSFPNKQLLLPQLSIVTPAQIAVGGCFRHQESRLSHHSETLWSLQLGHQLRLGILVSWPVDVGCSSSQPNGTRATVAHNIVLVATAIVVMPGLLEIGSLNVVSYLIFELNNFREKLTDNLLLLIFLRAFLQETEIIMLSVVQMGLFVERIEGHSVAALEDKLLSLLNVLKENFLLLFELLNPLNLLLPLDFCLLLIFKLIFLLLLFGICNVR